MTFHPRLGSIEPRERAGSQTGRKYEYQYERTARAALELLSSTSTPPSITIYCDWHDDFVTEIGVSDADFPGQYVFHQVKGRKSSQGAWSFREFFGVSLKEKRSPKPGKVSDNAIFPRMMLHHRNFGENCIGLAFVTNAGIEPSLGKFFADVTASATHDKLPVTSAAAFTHLYNSYLHAIPSISSTESELYACIKSLVVSTDQGTVDGGDDPGVREIADLVDQYSEIDLSLKQTKQIAREIISLVRRKVSHTSTSVPATDDTLRQDKGIVVEDLLPLLSLSRQAYAELRAGSGRDSVKRLSRLQRFCRTNNLDRQIVTVCSYKAKWDLWRTNERHSLNAADYIVLESRVRELLERRLPIEQLVAEAKNVSKDFSGTGNEPLSAEHVLGFAFSLAAEDEPGSN